MAQGSIRVQSESEYSIEVNDKGETIVFDLSDTSLTSRLFRMFERVDQLEREMAKAARDLDARPDEPFSTVETLNAETGEFESRTLITKNQYEGAKLIDDFYKQAREAIDEFMGPGACQKIFGDKNYLTMFKDLTTALEPEFKKMQINLEDIKHTAALKHAPNRQARRTLK